MGHTSQLGDMPDNQHQFLLGKVFPSFVEIFYLFGGGSVMTYGLKMEGMPKKPQMVIDLLSHASLSPFVVPQIWFVGCRLL